MRLTTTALFSLAALVFTVLLATPTARAADNYVIDKDHASIVFAAKHAGIAKIYGRFDQFNGKFVIDEEDLSKSSFEVTINVDSVNTGNARRDAHLRNPDFFNSTQFPLITFKSTKVEDKDHALHVTGDFTMHGVTRSITLEMNKGGKTEFPEGVHRIGFGLSDVIRRTDYGMDKLLAVVGDEVDIIISFEGIRQ